MKKKFLSFMLLLLALSLVGCKKGNPSATPTITPSTTPEATAPTRPGISVPTPTTSGVLPVITITSKENPHSLDFVTLPVARHVAEDIASWTPGYKMPPEPYYEACTITLTNPDNTVLLDAVDAQVKVRGNWTTTYDKKPLRLKFDQKQNLLGLNDGAEMKNWLLLAEYKDVSMLRNKTAIDIANELLAAEGLYVSDATFVEVVVNGTYWGLYLLAEQQQIHENRVNITEATAETTGTNIGYFLEYDGYYINEEDWQNFFVDYADNAPLTPFYGADTSGKPIRPLKENSSDPKKNTGITIKSDIYSQEQHDFIARYICNVYRIMYAAAYEDKAYVFNEDYSSISLTTSITPQQAVEAVVHVDSLAIAYILNEVACDADIYWSSFYMSVDFGETGDGRLRFEAPWDFDSAFGLKNRVSDGKGFYAASTVYDVNDRYQAINPWLAVLMQEGWFQDIIAEKWTKAYDDGVFTRAIATIQEDALKYQAAFAKNEARWDSLLNNDASSEWSNAVNNCRTHEQTVKQLTTWLQNRVTFLNEYWHK